jgi:hypothetical protein
MLFRHCTAWEIAIHHEIHTCETPSFFLRSRKSMILALFTTCGPISHV